MDEDDDGIVVDAVDTIDVVGGVDCVLDVEMVVSFVVDGILFMTERSVCVLKNRKERTNDRYNRVCV